MIKCKDCKVFSPQSECGGICGFTNFGTVKNDDDGCRAGAIINDIYNLGRKDAIEFISDKLIYPLLDEYDRGLWEHINHIELAEEWIKVLDDNPYPKVKNHTEARKRDLRQWIAEQLKEQNGE